MQHSHTLSFWSYFTCINHFQIAFVNFTHPYPVCPNSCAVKSAIFSLWLVDYVCSILIEHFVQSGIFFKGDTEKDLHPPYLALLFSLWNAGLNKLKKLIASLLGYLCKIGGPWSVGGMVDTCTWFIPPCNGCPDHWLQWCNPNFFQFSAEIPPWTSKFCSERSFIKIAKIQEILIFYNIFSFF